MSSSPRSLLATPLDVLRLKEETLTLPSWDLRGPQLWDLELLLLGAFHPLTGYLTEAEHAAVCKDARLPSGALWPIPVSLDVTERFVTEGGIAPGSRIVLRHPEGIPLAVLDVSDVYRPERAWEAQCVLGTSNEAHPGVFRLLRETDPVYLGGRVVGIEAPPHHTYKHLRWTPEALRAEFRQRGWDRIVAFQTRNPMHRAHVELVKLAAQQVDAKILLHPAVGRTSPGDVDYFTRVRCYEAVLPHLPAGSTMLSLLPLAMRMAGPREAIWHAIIRRNYGATHFIVGRDHAGPTDPATRRGFYGPYDAQAAVRAVQEEIGIEMVPVEELHYVPSRDAYMQASDVPSGGATLSLSGSELRRRLRAGEEIPPWFTYAEVVSELRRQTPPPAEQGFTVFFTGLPSSGKSTIAQTLLVKLMEAGRRPVTLLDGDLVRKHLSSELGFSREHRDLNVRRIGYVASEITKNGGVAICAPIAPYEATRRQVREMISEEGGFILIYVATPLEVCEKRDRKGLYAKARAGLAKGVTGIDDPYETPRDADVTIDTSASPPEAAAEAILALLAQRGYRPRLEDP